MRFRIAVLQHFLLGSVAVAGLATAASPAYARDASVNYNIAPQALGPALKDFGLQNGMAVMADAATLQGKTTLGAKGRMDPETALRTLLKGTGLSYRRDGNVFVVTAVQEPAPVRAEADDSFDDVVVTAQRKEEKIMDVPIAITAISGQAMWDRKIEGGPELLRAIPNVSFSKTNFSMYNFSIRGVGTQSISASSDPAVAVSFNSTPLVRNRLFESEFFDMARVEVLRGPQGTLYGRNATAGVVNMIPALPDAREFAGQFRAEAGSYSTTRLNGMINVPLTDTLAVRAAGAWTKRDGFDYNTFTNRRVNGRDLWSTRASVAWEPSDRFKANVIWQHFQENDDRLRTGKQLCTTDPGPARVGNIAIADRSLRGRISQGCLPGSLYDDAAFSTPNGASLVYLYLPSTSINMGTLRAPGQPARLQFLVKVADPFAGVTQSRNLREISSNYDPKFRAKNDVVQFNFEFEPSENLQFISQSAYSRDRFYSTQDYNRYVTVPLFTDTAQQNVYSGIFLNDPVAFPGPAPGGIACDPQLGCSDRMVSADLSRSRNRQWSQEFRLQSSFSGPLNFLAGANYLDFKSQDDYYVFNNMFTLIAQWQYSRRSPIIPGISLVPCELGNETRECPYVDPNPINSLNNQGHNYFLSQNGVRIRSWAAFGEIYWGISDRLKLTLGGRYTLDRKRADQVPSQLLLGGGINNPSGPALIGNITGGSVNSGYPAQPDILQSWGRFTGRAVLDWKPDLNFTDETLIYASAARGYKGGGVNPPRIDFNPKVVQYQYLPQTFRPEYVNAFEIGTKNSFNGGRLTLNATGFFYDYKDYQVSQIVDRIAYNENFNATSWGLELEAAWRPSRAFRIDGNLGYLRTRLGKGSRSIDVMNRTQGDPDWVVLRPWLQVPSNCVAPRAIVEKVLSIPSLAPTALGSLCPGADRIGSWNPARTANGPNFWQLYGVTYNPLAPYNPATIGLPINQGGSGAPNGGRGFYADLTGNELPNSPRLTGNIGAQYTFFLEDDDWELTFRGDYYRQSKSYGRIYNTAFDRLRGWDNFNAAVTLARPASGFELQLYVKNMFNKTPITGFFVNSDDTGLTTNVFTPDPRIIGFNTTVRF